MVALARQAEGVAKCGVPSSPSPSVPGRSRHVYDPYGRVTIYDADWSETRETSSYANTILYCGYYHDSETGLYHVRRRYYHPPLGRWLSRDPIGYVAEANAYAYASCAPTIAVDPLGLASIETGQTRFPWGIKAEVFEDLTKQATTGGHSYADTAKMGAPKSLRLAVYYATWRLYADCPRPSLELAAEKLYARHGGSSGTISLTYPGRMVKPLPIAHTMERHTTSNWVVPPSKEAAASFFKIVEVGGGVETGRIDTSSDVDFMKVDDQCIIVNATFNMRKRAPRAKGGVAILGVDVKPGSLIGNDVVTQATVQYKICAWCQCDFTGQASKEEGEPAQLQGRWNYVGTMGPWLEGQFVQGSAATGSGRGAVSWQVTSYEGMEKVGENRYRPHAKQRPVPEVGQTTIFGP